MRGYDEVKSVNGVEEEPFPEKRKEGTCCCRWVDRRARRKPVWTRSGVRNAERASLWEQSLLFVSPPHPTGRQGGTLPSCGVRRVGANLIITWDIPVSFHSIDMEQILYIC